MNSILGNPFEQLEIFVDLVGHQYGMACRWWTRLPGLAAHQRSAEQARRSHQQGAGRDSVRSERAPQTELHMSRNFHWTSWRAAIHLPGLKQITFRSFVSHRENKATIRKGAGCNLIARLRFADSMGNTALFLRQAQE